MHLTQTHKLLAAYVEDESEEAFRELVQRYLNLVYSTALRRVGGQRQLADDVVQIVFLELAKKAAALDKNIMLGGWLHRHCCYAADKMLRSESRRHNREQGAAAMQTLNEANEDWNNLAPVLDEAIQHLEATDRSAIFLRFFEELDLRSVGQALGVSEDAAQKRVSRSIEKLRQILQERGVMISSTILAASLSTKVIEGAPDPLGKLVLKQVREQKAANSIAGRRLTTWLKFAALGILLLVPGSLFLSRVRLSDVQGVARAPSGQEQRGALEVLNPASLRTQDLATGMLVSGSNGRKSVFAKSGQLKLRVITDDSGQPVPNVGIKYLAYENELAFRKQFSASREGVCTVPYSREQVSQLILTTQCDGFAETTLEWRPDRGAKIPAEHILRLKRAVAIGGRVLDPKGMPISGAELGITILLERDQEGQIETHAQHVETITGEDGKWSINRIAEGVMQRLQGAGSHEGYTTALFDSRDGRTLKALREGDYILTLGIPSEIQGIVLTKDEIPVPHAKILVGYAGMQQTFRAESDENGRFVAKVMQPGEQLLSAEAPGYAATTERVMPGTKFVRLVLQEGRSVLIHVQTPDGTAIPGATVWFNNLVDNTMPQANFNRKTDANGVLLWTNAPDRELPFQVYAKDFIRNNVVKVPRETNAFTVTLAYALHLSGTVRDSRTGDPLSKFKIILGSPVEGTGKSSIHWGDQARQRLTFENGVFDYKCQSPLEYATTNSMFVFRFEAESYGAYVSRVVSASEREFHVDVRLNETSTNSFTVMSEAGVPAAGATIAFLEPGTKYVLSGRRFSSRSAAVFETDREGRFACDSVPKGEIHIAAQEGYGVLPPEELKSTRTIVLVPWGFVEGTVMFQEKPLAGAELVVGFSDGKRDGVEFHQSDYTRQTDANGWFRIDAIPRTWVNLYSLLQQGNGEQSAMRLFEAGFELKAGPAAPLTIRYQPCRLRVSEKWDDGHGVPNGKRSLVLRNLNLHPPSNPAARANWEGSWIIRGALARQRSYLAKEIGDEIWSFDAIKAGHYYATLTVESNDAAGGIFVGQFEVDLKEQEVAGSLEVKMHPMTVP